MSVTFVVVSVVLLCFRPIFPFSSFQPFLFIGGFDSSALCKSRRELSLVYFLAKFGFDTAETEPCKVCSLFLYLPPSVGLEAALHCSQATLRVLLARRENFGGEHEFFYVRSGRWRV